MDKLKQTAEDRPRAELAVSIAGAAIGATREDVIGSSRGYRAELARQVAMYLLHVGGGISLGRTAAAFGRDRSTVAHAVRALELRRDQPEFDTWMQALEDSYARAPVMA